MKYLRVFQLVTFAILLPITQYFAAGTVLAHSTSQAYLTVNATDDGAIVQWYVAAEDLNLFVPLDHDLDGSVIWSEIEAATAIANRFARDRISAQSPNGTCQKDAGNLLLSRRSGAAYVVFTLQFRCPDAVSSLTFTYHGLWPALHGHRATLKRTGMADKVLSEQASTFAMPSGR